MISQVISYFILCGEMLGTHTFAQLCKHQFCVKVYIIYCKFLSERVLVEFNWSEIINHISIMCQAIHNLCLILLMWGQLVFLFEIIQVRIGCVFECYSFIYKQLCLWIIWMWWKGTSCNVIIPFKPGLFSPFGHFLLEVSNLLLGFRSWSVTHVIKDGIISQGNCWLCKGFHR